MESRMLLSMLSAQQIFTYQEKMGLKIGLADNQAPGGKNGGKSRFKQNRRIQLKKGFKAKR